MGRKSSGTRQLDWSQPEFCQFSLRLNMDMRWLTHLVCAAFVAAIHVPANRITETLRQKRSITADTALRLARYSLPRPITG